MPNPCHFQDYDGSRPSRFTLEQLSHDKLRKRESTNAHSIALIASAAWCRMFRFFFWVGNLGGLGFGGEGLGFGGIASDAWPMRILFSLVCVLQLQCFIRSWYHANPVKVRSQRWKNLVDA